MTFCRRGQCHAAIHQSNRDTDGAGAKKGGGEGGGLHTITGTTWMRVSISKVVRTWRKPRVKSSDEARARSHWPWRARPTLAPRGTAFLASMALWAKRAKGRR